MKRLPFARLALALMPTLFCASLALAAVFVAGVGDFPDRSEIFFTCPAGATNTCQCQYDYWCPDPSGPCQARDAFNAIQCAPLDPKGPGGPNEN